jgi:hypothetical protein
MRVLFVRAIPAALVGAALLLAGCVTQETRPMPKLVATQATGEIPEAQLLDVGIRLFDPGVPKELLDDPELAAKKGIFPDIRKAEARYLPTQLKATLESTAQWGAVRVVPPTVETLDVMVSGRILESTGYSQSFEATVSDSTGRVWFTKRYEQMADTASYRDGPYKGRDPYQNLYVALADDMLKYRETLSAMDRANLRRVSDLRFGADLAPAVYNGYLRKDSKGIYQVQGLPAGDDPVVERVERIRERDENLVDTVSDQYGLFSEKIAEPYGNWRRYTYDEIEASEELRKQANTRKILGGAAVLAGIFMPSPCGNSRTCDRAESAARTGAVVGGVMAVMSGVKKGQEIKIHEAAIKEISGSFQTEASSSVVEVEGRTLRLTGTAEEQYAEWRKLLHELYVEETGGVTADSAPAAPAAPATTAAPATPGSSATPTPGS